MLAILLSHDLIISHNKSPVMSDLFDIYIPDNLRFHDYIAIVQTARVWADGYDRKV